MTIFVKACRPTYDQDLMREFRPVLSCAFTVDCPSRVYVSGHVDSHHRGLVSGAVMVAYKVAVDGSWVPGSTTGGNIINETQHYESHCIHAFAEVAAGNHTVTLYGRSASTLLDRDGLAEVKGDYTEMLVRVE